MRRPPIRRQQEIDPLGVFGRRDATGTVGLFDDRARVVEIRDELGCSWAEAERVLREQEGEGDGESCNDQ